MKKQEIISNDWLDKADIAVLLDVLNTNSTNIFDGLTNGEEYKECIKETLKKMRNKLEVEGNPKNDVFKKYRGWRP